MKKKVIFVCMGNICRSPTAEGVMLHMVKERGLADVIEVSSAGTLDYHAGDPADPRSRQAASRRGYVLDRRAKQVRVRDLEEYDLVIAMDRANKRDLLALDPAGKQHHKIKLLGEFLDGDDHADVPDPYYGGPAGFETVLDMAEAACGRLIEHLLGPGEGKGR